ncbi:hypothetical protein VIB_001929 [Vibrio metschnikovii CIP 69.14]|nr:hypothetical protein VIB_001929 [Vibrio metschnikovii CIP 69.14]
MNHHAQYDALDPLDKPHNCAFVRALTPSVDTMHRSEPVSVLAIATWFFPLQRLWLMPSIIPQNHRGFIALHA